MVLINLKRAEGRMWTEFKCEQGFEVCMYVTSTHNITGQVVWGMLRPTIEVNYSWLLHKGPRSHVCSSDSPKQWIIRFKP